MISRVLVGGRGISFGKDEDEMQCRKCTDVSILYKSGHDQPGHEGEGQKRTTIARGT